MASLGHRHPYRILGFLRGSLRLMYMHPRTLVADIGHFKQGTIQSGLAQGSLKERFMGTRSAGRHHQPVQLVLLNGLGQHPLRVLGTGIHVG